MAIPAPEPIINHLLEHIDGLALALRERPCWLTVWTSNGLTMPIIKLCELPHRADGPPATPLPQCYLDSAKAFVDDPNKVFTTALIGESSSQELRVRLVAVDTVFFAWMRTQYPGLAEEKMFYRFIESTVFRLRDAMSDPVTLSFTWKWLVILTSGHVCDRCGKREGDQRLQTCTCRAARYCGRTCQAEAWGGHRDAHKAWRRRPPVPVGGLSLPLGRTPASLVQEVRAFLAAHPSVPAAHPMHTFNM
jgi:hypothetical protein